MSAFSSHSTYVVLVNGEQWPGIWPADFDVPPGWADTGVRGGRDEVLAEVARRWREQPQLPLAAGGRAGETLTELFAATVAARADQPAVSDGRRRLTYRELDEHAGALAAMLRERGVGPGHHVAFQLLRGVDVFVAMLGILKAGAAYVAIDDSYPDQRRDEMLRQAGVRIVIASPDLVDRIPGFDIATLPAGDPPAHPGHESSRSAAQAACIMFTSGSTGLPKAVVLEDGNLVHFARNAALPRLQPHDRVGQVSSVSFDAFHFEAWCTFAAGGEVVVMGSLAQLMNSDVQRELRRSRITAMLVPTMAVNHVTHEDRDAFAPLRLLHTGGDVLQPAAARELLAGAFTGAFVNLYGPTEATTACVAYHVTGVADGDRSVPIGRPLAGSAVYVLDAAGQETDVMEVGELFVGGAGVGAGYLGDPVLTAERFVPDPFAGDGSRMYATGDLAYRRADGLLEFVGRSDDQVKIRGFRVEPAEAERALCGHPQVRDAAVIVVGEGDLRHLVALVVVYGELAPRDLRAYAAGVLPGHLVPSAIVKVREIPSNGHGKRDKNGLRSIAESELRRSMSRINPQSEVERKVAGIWEQLLGVEQLSTTDDFFALGGNSLLVLTLRRRIAKELGVQLASFDVLSTSELGQLASLIDSRRTVQP